MSNYTPSTEEVAYAYRSEGDGGIVFNRDHSDEGFYRWLQTVKAEAWNEALAHVESLSDPASTIDIYPERELITLADVAQAREENPYTKENNK